MVTPNISSRHSAWAQIGPRPTRRASAARAYIRRETASTSRFGPSSRTAPGCPCWRAETPPRRLRPARPSRSERSAKSARDHDAGPRFRARSRGRARGGPGPPAVRRFSSHCCSMWIRAHWRSQNTRCWRPESGRRSSSSNMTVRRNDPAELNTRRAWRSPSSQYIHGTSAAPPVP